jgi:hypothetical protein
MVIEPSTWMFRVAVLFTLAGVIPAHAETRITLRVGVLPLELESSRDTPLFGDDLSRAIDRYNAAAAAFDRATGLTTERMNTRDVDVSETLYVAAPGIEFGGSRFYFRLEAPIGLGDDLTTVGLGIYPLNVQAKLPSGTVGYLSFGGTASWLDRPGAGDVGGLFVARAAGGARFARHLSFEVGVSAFAIGGSVNNARLSNLSLADLGTPPDELVSGGEGHGMVDVSVGVTF